MSDIAWFVVFFVLSALALRTQQNVVTCSGKIQSDFKINYSKINIDLYAKSGSLIESSDCAPNNGYFVVPVYDKGDYVLKIAPPTGWGFDPSEVKISLDGESDVCSLKEDIVFKFVGFTVSGQVNSVGNSDGPRGVKVSIKGPELFKETETLDGGFFELPNILPGKYTVQGSHPVWNIVQEAPVSVIVSDGTVLIPENSILVEGYDVKGYIKSKSEPVAEVLFLLYEQQGNNASGIKRKLSCRTAQASPKLADVPPPSCVATSSKEGMFVFPSLPTGNYRIVPYYQSEESMYQVSPGESQFSVVNDSVIIEPDFEVHGFSVYGTVLWKENGEGLSGANVIVEGSLRAKADEKGKYQLLNVTAGTYNVEVTAPDVEFEPIKLTLTPSAPRIPSIYPSRFSVCGELKIKVHPSKKPFKSSSCSVEVKPDADASKPLISASASVDSNGQFCVMLAPGKYSVKVIINVEDTERGLAFQSPVLPVSVQDRPVEASQLSFVQFTGGLSVKVQCIGLCRNVEVTLEKPFDNFKKVKAAQRLDKSMAQASFDGLLPGSYKVSVSSDASICWKEDQQTIVISSSSTPLLVSFTQSGFKMEIKSTHATNVQLIRNNDQSSSKIINVKKGMNSFCMEQHGDYNLLPKSCYTFDGDMYIFITTMPALVEMKATGHMIKGNVIVPNGFDISVNISISKNKKPGKDNILELSAPPPSSSSVVGGGDYNHSYGFAGKPGNVVTIQPLSSKLICSPPVQVFTVGDVCPESVPPFHCSQGLFITGVVEPPLEGVVVTITLAAGKEKQLIVRTDKSGRYKAGPVTADSSYTVEPNLAQYVFHPLSENNQLDFKAIKVSRITIKIVDGNGNPLNDALVSISGEDFRSTDLANEEGTFAYSNLSPGEYYIKPILREFEFAPSSQVVVLAQGEDLSSTFTGKKVAFSVSGKVMSLNRTPLQKVTVKVAGIDGDRCASFRETSVSDDNGVYKFRGVMPTCSYSLSVVTADEDSIVEAAIPRERFLQISDDVSGEDFVAILKPTQLTVTGHIVTPNPEHLQTLKVVVYSDKFMDSVVYSTAPDLLGFFSVTLKPSSVQSTTCYVRAETSLSGHYYAIEANTTSFSTSDFNGHVSLYFSAQPAVGTVDSSVRGSFVGIFIAVAAVFLIFNIDKIFGSIQSTKTTDLFRRFSGVRKTKKR